MDVRCEKCQNEYELDESRVKPGGVTVKCTNCGHMFKIRRRTSTSIGPSVIGPTVTPSSPHIVVRNAPATGTQRPVARPTGSPAAGPVPLPRTTTDSTSPPNERMWMLRLENGDNRTCKELGTLQQWIISGVVTRDALISRNGKTWKRIGDIAELGTFFTIAEHAKQPRVESRTLSGLGNSAALLQPTELDLTVKKRLDTTVRGGPADGSIDTNPNSTTLEPVEQRDIITQEAPPVTPAAKPATSVAPPLRTERPITQPPPLPRQRAQTASRPPVVLPPPTEPPVANPPSDPRGTKPSDSPPRGSFAGFADTSPSPNGAPPPVDHDPFAGPQAGIPMAHPQAESDAFTGKLALGASADPAFATSGRYGSTAGHVRTEPGADVFGGTATLPVASDDDDDDMFGRPKSSRTAQWVALGSLAVIAGALTIVYFTVFYQPATPTRPLSDAGPSALVVSPDAPPVDAGVDLLAEALSAANVDTIGDVTERLQLQAKTLAALPVAQTDARILVARARLQLRLAQQQSDAALLHLEAAQASKAKTEAKALLASTVGLVTKALALAPDDVGANLMMAELMRLQGKPTPAVMRYLEAARTRKAAEWARDELLSQGLLLQRDNKLADAQAVLGQLDGDEHKLEATGDARGRFQLALLAFVAKRYPEAERLTNSLLAAQPTHAGALNLAARLASVVAQTDPLPLEEPAPPPSDTPAPPAANPEPSNAKPTTIKPVPVEPVAPASSDSYDRLISKADALAETSCAKANELYSKALDQKPSGVEALVGLGFCALDAKQYASAFSRFRAALAVSPRNERALWGVAETYQQQGRKAQAIEGYERYLESYPQSSAAKKQLDRLREATPAPAPPAAAPPPEAPVTPSPGSLTTTPDKPVSE